MNKLKKISTVIPTFNRDRFLKKTIQSCLDQTLKHEIIICNHGSTDKTDEVVMNFGKNIKYIKKNKDYGTHFCWLDGILAAEGEYINLLFDDDWLEKTYLEKCMKYFDYTDVGFVFSAAKVYDDEKQQIIHSLHDKFITKSGLFKISKYESYFLRYLISPSSIIIRKKDIIDSIFIGKLPFAKYTYKGVGPDKLMILLCLLRYKNFGYVAEKLSVYRFHKDSITINSSLSKDKDLLLKKSYEEVTNYYYTLKYGRYLSNFQNKYFLFLRVKMNNILNKIYNFFS